MKKTILLVVGALLVLCLGSVALYQLPPVQDRLAWRLDNLRSNIKYLLNPPEEAVFIPEGQSDASPTPLPPTPTPTSTATPAVDNPTPEPLPTATITPTPLPEQVLLAGVKYEDQHGRYNYCGPANLSMAMTYWGWQGDRDIVGRGIKPLTDDKNVMPYEMQEFIANNSELTSVIREGGDIDVIRRLVAAGYPVLLEKGTFLTDLAGEYSWMGHYQLATGYDDARQVMVVQDSYVGENHEMSYEGILEGWRAFNFVFLVAYPPEQEAEVMALLGPYQDERYGYEMGAELASEEIFRLENPRDRYFAWFNRGTSLMGLQDYGGASAAFDEAFSNVYPTIPAGERPWRMMWYQTSPYKAYFYAGRYWDVLNLATTTLEDFISEPVLEESFYWRALAKEALGDVTGAIADMREAVRLNPNFTAGKQQLDRLQGGG